MRRTLVVLIVLLGAGLGACRADREPPEGAHVIARATFTTDAGEVRTAFLEVADSPDERARGLIGRTSLPKDGGMVFVFGGPTDAGFWMEDTRIPLSIAFWGEDGRVVDILDMRPCRAAPCPVYRSRGPYTAALEMTLGWFEEHGVEIGDRVALFVGTE